MWVGEAQSQSQSCASGSNSIMKKRAHPLSSSSGSNYATAKKSMQNDEHEMLKNGNAETLSPVKMKASVEGGGGGRGRRDGRHLLRPRLVQLGR